VAEQRGDCGCDDVLRDVWLFLDDEMNPQRRAAVKQHLDDCSPCLEEAGLDAKLKSLLHRKCGGDKAPEQLRARLLAAMQEVTISVQTDGSVTTSTVTTTTVVRGQVGPTD
jgi:mycothiol system anti-sigma-R factor